MNRPTPGEPFLDNTLIAPIEAVEGLDLNDLCDEYGPASATMMRLRPSSPDALRTLRQATAGHSLSSPYS